MLGSEKKPKKIDLNYYVINNQLFRVAYIISCNLHNTNFQILSTKIRSFWRLNKFCVHHKWKEVGLGVINWYIRVASGLAKRLKT